MTVLTLLRWRLALMNGVSALGGYLLFPAAIELSRVLAAFGGTALLAAGCSAINQVLERDLDCLMERTKGRPLPTGAMSVATAAGIGSACLLAGLIWMGFAGSLVTALLGTAALFWYLAVYTPLKRLTSMSLPIGALCGAFSPLIGWALAGGKLSHHRILLVAGVMFLWQIPHFWLLQRRYRTDYRAAGIPLCEDATGNSRTPLFALWITALVAGAMLLPVLGIIPQQRAFWYALFLLPIFLSAFLPSEKFRFACLNLFPLLLTLSIWL